MECQRPTEYGAGLWIANSFLNTLFRLVTDVTTQNSTILYKQIKMGSTNFLIVT
jgi:hypothetical protein